MSLAAFIYFLSFRACFLLTACQRTPQGGPVNHPGLQDILARAAVHHYGWKSICSGSIMKLNETKTNKKGGQDEFPLQPRLQILCDASRRWECKEQR
jgi:hypothetical protein